MIERRRITATVEEWSTPKGTLRIERVSREAVVFRATGHLAAEHADAFRQAVDEAIVDGRPHLFWDGHAMTGYDTEFRQKTGAHCAEVKDRVQSMQVYTPSRMVAMGASVINMWLGGFFTMVKTREELEQRIAEARGKRPSMRPPP